MEIAATMYLSNGLKASRMSALLSKLLAKAMPTFYFYQFRNIYV